MGRAASILAVLTILAAPAAFAAERDRDLGRKFFEQAKRFVVTVFSRLGGPPG
ncbi:MAG TPA: hypothetical protein VFO89_09290 [Thermoanaerobaculia bacterium]|nr:hypothetical protein [Thermoanaerobaculia bacterium]